MSELIATNNVEETEKPSELIEFTELQKRIAERFYRIFYKALIRISKSKYRMTSFNVDSDIGDRFYSAALDSYYYSITKFDNLENIETDKAVERKFVQFIYYNIGYYIKNAIKKAVRTTNNDSSINESDEFYSYVVENKHRKDYHTTFDSYLDIQGKITQFVRNVEFTDLAESSLNRSQIQYILNLIFSKENYEYLYSLNTHGKTILSKEFSNFFAYLFEQYKTSDVDRCNFNISTFKTFKMKIYPVLKSFLCYIQE